ncbi:MAG TPA: efflux RND transporter periplasmic adaptor subunit, partial [Haloferula sp.]
MNASRISRLVIPIFRCAVTLAVVIAGAHAARLLWRHYRIEPWTRDGRVNAESVTIVPEVSGKVSSILISDNQEIRKGDVLFEIDSESYRLALQSAEATLATRQHELALAQEQAARRRPLAGQHAISAEELQKAESVRSIATSGLDVAVSARDTAKLNLDRTTVVSPVNGYITN